MMNLLGLEGAPASIIRSLDDLTWYEHRIKIKSIILHRPYRVQYGRNPLPGVGCIERGLPFDKSLSPVQFSRELFYIFIQIIMRDIC